ncbi:hypothetical protein TcasGA2_TC002159 [Tribolium castaneum]|uniref:Uncharacterized protein n=1 Tax=Tribolium castaneum TaxID=7070 RepID=D7GXH2_TRICA|nr:hypothetical protein TcasGA2_TC002159 [Tribolium castaneum]
MSSGKDTHMSLSVTQSKKCKKCKYPITSGISCVNCGSLSPPSCSKLLKNVKIISDSQLICCDKPPDDPQTSEVADTDVSTKNNESSHPGRLINRSNELTIKKSTVKNNQQQNVQLQKPSISSGVPRQNSVDLPDTDAEKDTGGWEIPTQRNRRQRTKKTQNVVYGNAKTNLEQNFTAKPNKKAWIYLGKVKPDTDEDVIRNYVSRKLPEADELIVEKLNSAGKNESFKIGINFVFKDNISSAGFWPDGVLIRRFHFGKKPFLGETGEPTNENSQALLEGTS